MNNIYGITDFKEYPSYINKEFSKSVFSIISIELFNDRLDYIYELVVRARCENYKLIKTILGNKLLIEIIIEYKVIYVSKEDNGVLRKIKKTKCVEEFLLLDKTKFNLEIKIRELFIGIEDIFIKKYTETNIQIGCLIVACPCITIR